MVLFEFDKIMGEKYKNYKIYKSEKIKGIDYEQFYQIGIEKITKIFPFYFSGINEKYIIQIVQDKKNKILFSCIDKKFNLKNITSLLIYHKTKTLAFNKYYIYALGTHEEFRNFGYGKVIIDDFIDWIKLKNKSGLKNKILLKSLESSLKFYQDYGFVSTELEHNRLFFKYETAIELKTNPEKILELIIE